MWNRVFATFLGRSTQTRNLERDYAKERAGAYVVAGHSNKDRSSLCAKRIARCLCGIITIVPLTVVPTVGWATSFSYTVINYPNASTTGATGINDIGQIVGDYQDENENYHGFLLSGGTYTTIDYPAKVDEAKLIINPTKIKTARLFIVFLPFLSSSPNDLQWQDARWVPGCWRLLSYFV
jgi:probable HAF family extracellular repeat protein